jgi:hypothetical protein
VSDATVRITQHELAEIAELQREVSFRSKRLEELKSNVKAMLLHRIPIERGRFDAKLRKIVCRSVPWKSLFLKNSVRAWRNGSENFTPPAFASMSTLLNMPPSPCGRAKKKIGSI